MAPKFPNPDPATDSVRDRLDQFKEVAGRAVYPPLAVAPSPTTPGQIWWDVSSTVKIRDEANADWADLLAVIGGQPAGSYVRYDAQTLTSPQQAQARTNIGAQMAGSYQSSGGYMRYDQAQSLTGAEITQALANIGVSLVKGASGRLNIGGTIIQYGSTSVPAGGFGNVTLPLAFPNNFRIVVVSPREDAGASFTYVVTGHPSNTSQMYVTGMTVQAGTIALAAVGFSYIAIGD